MTTNELDAPVIIVGAGLAGLNCARLLHESGRRTLLIDVQDRIGGRVQTDAVEGFLLDRGFQVFQTAYPEAKLALDYADLHLTPLETGALVRHRGKWAVMADPWRQPQKALSTLFNTVGNIGDRIKLYQLRRSVLSKSIDELLSESADCSTREFLLERCGFSQSFYDLFLKPWWSGIFLETELSTSAAYFQFVFRILAAGDVSLPRSGIQAIPDQLARRLPSESFRLSTRVVKLNSHSVELDSGEVLEGSAVVLATDGTSASQLIHDATDSTSSRPPAIHWSKTQCMYFAADRPPHSTRLLMLRGDSVGPVNHVFIPTNSVPRFAPPDQSLISVSLVNPSGTPEELMPEVRDQLLDLYGPQVREWRFLRAYDIAHALPKQPPNFYAQRQSGELPAPDVANKSIVRCGDYLETSSVQGSLVSGRKAAEKLLLKNGRA